ncbi:MAG: RtcB family protein [Acholeplasmataceae bacterium]
MMQLSGKYGKAKVFVKELHETTKSQIIDLLDQPWTKDVMIRIMPDVHPGSDAVIGLTMRLNGQVEPSFVGNDIGCGMSFIKFRGELDFKRLDEVIKTNGIGSQERTPLEIEFPFEQLHCYKDINKTKALRSFATLGGGNHFIEVNKASNDETYLVIHSGSRNLGQQVYDAHKANTKNYYHRLLINEMIEDYKKRGLEKQIHLRTLELHKENQEKPTLLEGRAYEYYLDDLLLTKQFASLSRKKMIEIIVSEMNWEVISFHETIHNYIERDTQILRKGAIRSLKDELVLIPINMKDGSILAKGKGYASWNYSSPHGAGRILRRSIARKTLDVDTFKRSMEGIYSSTIGYQTLDESPLAYNTIEHIVKLAKNIDIIDILKPLYNFKGN